MSPNFLSMRLRPDRDERLRRKCAAVYDAYAYWTNAPMEETDLPFAAYSAALDREQSAATVYGRALDRLKRSLD